MHTLTLALIVAATVAFGHLVWFVSEIFGVRAAAVFCLPSALAARPRRPEWVDVDAWEPGRPHWGGELDGLAV